VSLVRVCESKLEALGMISNEIEVLGNHEIEVP
jgi:hypothetical protein